jgi:uncharacterized membrane protein
MQPDGSNDDDKALRWARKVGEIAMGLTVGFLLLIASIEFARNIGNLAAFQYQGY